jgi:hypothetical protein
MVSTPVFSARPRCTEKRISWMFLRIRVLVLWIAERIPVWSWNMQTYGPSSSCTVFRKCFRACILWAFFFTHFCVLKLLFIIRHLKTFVVYTSVMIRCCIKMRPSIKFLSHIILLSMPRSSKWSLPCRFSGQNFVRIIHLSHASYMPGPSYPNDILWRIQSMKLLIMQSSPAFCCFLPT